MGEVLRAPLSLSDFASWAWQAWPSGIIDAAAASPRKFRRDETGFALEGFICVFILKLPKIRLQSAQSDYGDWDKLALPCRVDEPDEDERPVTSEWEKVSASIKAGVNARNPSNVSTYADFFLFFFLPSPRGSSGTLAFGRYCRSDCFSSSYCESPARFFHS